MAETLEKISLKHLAEQQGLEYLPTNEIRLVKLNNFRYSFRRVHTGKDGKYISENIDIAIMSGNDKEDYIKEQIKLRIETITKEIKLALEKPILYLTI
jgi:hypothetical protein